MMEETPLETLTHPSYLTHTGPTSLCPHHAPCHPNYPITRTHEDKEPLESRKTLIPIPLTGNLVRKKNPFINLTSTSSEDWYPSPICMSMSRCCCLSFPFLSQTSTTSISLLSTLGLGLLRIPPLQTCYWLLHAGTEYQRVLGTSSRTKCPKAFSWLTPRFTHF